MRTKIIFVVIIIAITTNVSAQLTVDTSGNVGIGDTLSSYNSPLSINIGIREKCSEVIRLPNIKSGWEF